MTLLTKLANLRYAETGAMDATRMTMWITGILLVVGMVMSVVVIQVKG